MILASFAASAFAGPVVTGDLGDASSTDIADWSYKLNVVDVVSSVRLLHVSPRIRYTAADGADALYFVVYEETAQNDWDLIWDSGPQAVGAVLGFHDSPEIDQVLTPGTRYAVGWWMPDGNYTYFFDAAADLANPTDLGWGVFAGSVFSLENTTYTLQTAIANAPPQDNEYQMKLTVEILDGDGDGFDEGQDCDDTVATTFPGAPELCDGVDNDCTGVPDDPVDAILWYEDTDADGFGDDLAVHDLCDGSAPAEGWVQVVGDCDDGDVLIHPGALEYCDARDGDCDGAVDNDLVPVDGWADLDGDGFGDPANPAPWCERELPGDVSLDDLDCDDTDPLAFPGSVEVCDGRDDDCDGLADEELPTTIYWTDDDGDGVGVESLPIVWCDVVPPGAAESFGDCDDGDPVRFPGNEEVCDGADNDCDEAIPDDEHDGDGDGWFACEDCADDNLQVWPGAVEVCDGLDRDCDGVIPDPVECDPAANEEVEIPGCGCATGGAPIGWWVLAAVIGRRRTRG